MSNVIDLNEYRRARLDQGIRRTTGAFLRRARPRPVGRHTVSGSDLTDELRRLLMDE